MLPSATSPPPPPPSPPPPSPSPSSKTKTTTSPSLSSLASFIYALKSPESQRVYPGRLKLFFDYLGLSGPLEEQAEAFLKKAKEENDNGSSGGGSQWVQDSIISFFNHHKQRVQKKEITAGTLHNYYDSIKLFCEMNDNVVAGINWKRIARGLPRRRKLTANDRAPTVEEIRRVVEYPDRRIKAIVYTMCSSGIRLGAWANEDLGYYLRWKHVTPITNDKGEVIAAKLLVYAEEPEEYYTFITPEAYSALTAWMDFRILHGEKITGDSPLMRDLWSTTSTPDVKKYGGRWGLATNPKPLRKAGIKKLLNRALRVQGLRRTPLLEGKMHHEWKAAHGYRKFFKTRAEQVMKPLNVELLLSHDTGISDFYYRPTEEELLEDYLKAVDLLSINYDNDKKVLQKQVSELTQKSKDESYVIKGQLAEKEKEFEEMKKKVDALTDAMRQLRKTNELRADFNEYQKNMALHDPEMREVMKEVEKEQVERAKYFDRLEQEAADVVDAEFEAEFPSRLVVVEEEDKEEEEYVPTK